MMFRSTTHIYDLIYEAAGKDYAAESAEVDAAIKARNPGASSLLDVACGTGAHLAKLVDSYDVSGVDLDPGMLAQAERRLPPDTPLVQADMRNFSLGRQFDAVICLFSSIGYMASTDDLRDAIRNMAEHLHAGGVLILDGWVRPDAWRPSNSVHIDVAEGDELSVVRVARSERNGPTTHLEMHHLVASPGQGGAPHRPSRSDTLRAIRVRGGAHRRRAYLRGRPGPHRRPRSLHRYQVVVRDIENTGICLLSTRQALRSECLSPPALGACRPVAVERKVGEHSTVPGQTCAIKVGEWSAPVRMFCVRKRAYQRRLDDAPVTHDERRRLIRDPGCDGQPKLELFGYRRCHRLLGGDELAVPDVGAFPLPLIVVGEPASDVPGADVEDLVNGKAHGHGCLRRPGCGTYCHEGEGSHLAANDPGSSDTFLRQFGSSTSRLTFLGKGVPTHLQVAHAGFWPTEPVPTGPRLGRRARSSGTVAREGREWLLRIHLPLPSAGKRGAESPRMPDRWPAPGSIALEHPSVRGSGEDQPGRCRSATISQ